MELKYRRNSFNYEKACGVLASLWEHQDPSSPEFAALQESAHAMLFPFVPPDSFYNEKGRIVASPEELLTHMERGHAYVAYLAPWVEEVRHRATDEQQQYLKDAGLDGGKDEDTGSACSIGHKEEEPEGPESEHQEPAEIFPDPAQAVSILEALAHRYDRSTVQHTAIELGVQTLRFILDTGQADAFCTFLEEGQKPVAPEKLARFGISAA